MWGFRKQEQVSMWGHLNWIGLGVRVRDAPSHADCRKSPSHYQGSNICYWVVWTSVSPMTPPWNQESEPLIEEEKEKMVSPFSNEGSLYVSSIVENAFLSTIEETMSSLESKMMQEFQSGSALWAFEPFLLGYPHVGVQGCLDWEGAVTLWEGIPQAQKCCKKHLPLSRWSHSVMSAPPTGCSHDWPPFWGFCIRACNKSSIGGVPVQSAICVPGNPQVGVSSLPGWDCHHPCMESKGQPAETEWSASQGTGRANLVCLGQGKLRGRGQAQKGGKKQIDWCYTKYTIRVGMIADLQSEVTRAMTEVTMQARKWGLPAFTWHNQALYLDIFEKGVWPHLQPESSCTVVDTTALAICWGSRPAA